MGVGTSRPKAGAADLPGRLVEHILGLLSHQDRARCELVCRHWLAASRSSTALWHTVEWGSKWDRLGKLRWLVPHRLVQRVRLELSSQGWEPMSPRKVFTAAAANLAPWAPSLQRLSLCLARQLGDSLGWLGGLQQLMWLHLALHLAEPPRVALDWLGSLQRLRTLHWQVLYQWAPTGVLPPLPTGLEHLLLSGGCLYHMNGLGRLTALQMLVCCSSTGRYTQLPPGLSTLASLRYLQAASMSNTEELCHLPQLEGWQSCRRSCPRRCGCLTCAATTAPSQRLPGVDVLATMSQLRRLCLWFPNSSLPAPRVRGVTSLAALPALEALCFDTSCERGEGVFVWEQEEAASLLVTVLRDTKPGLKVATVWRNTFRAHNTLHSHSLEWPERGLFDLHSAN